MSNDNLLPLPKPTPLTTDLALEDKMYTADQVRQAQRDAVAASGAGVLAGWQALFDQVALALNCLPSSFLDGNDHVIKAAAMLAAAPTPGRAPHASTAGEYLSAGQERGVNYLMDAVQHYADTKDESTKARIRRMLEDDAAKLSARNAVVRDAALEESGIAVAIHSQYPIETDFDRGYSKARKDSADKIRALRATSAIAPAGEAVTDEQLVGVLHSLGIDTRLSAYGFDALQVNGTNVPGIRNVVMKCIASIASRAWPAPLYDFDSDGKVVYRATPATAAPSDADKSGGRG